MFMKPIENQTTKTKKVVLRWLQLGSPIPSAPLARVCEMAPIRRKMHKIGFALSTFSTTSRSWRFIEEGY